MKYIVVSAADPIDLQGFVNMYLEVGYEPIGGLCSHGNKLHQALQCTRVDTTTEGTERSDDDSQSRYDSKPVPRSARRPRG